MSTLSGFKLALLLFIINPLVENILSKGTEVAGIHNSFLATFDKMGKQWWFNFHHLSGSVLGSAAGSLMKTCISSCGLLVSLLLPRLLPKRYSIALSVFGFLVVGSSSSFHLHLLVLPQLTSPVYYMLEYVAHCLEISSGDTWGL